MVGQIAQVDYRQPDAARILAGNLLRVIQWQPVIPPILWFLLGADDGDVYDALGPVTGWLLSQTAFRGSFSGDLDSPIHADNATSRFCEAVAAVINRYQTQPLVIAVDACIDGPIGLLSAGQGGVIPGQVHGRLMPGLGHMHLLGNTGSRLKTVVGMAQVITQTVLLCEQSLGVSRTRATATIRRG